MNKKIIGEGVKVTEFIKKEFITKNTIRRIIERKETKTMKLECGHEISMCGYTKAPTNYTNCYKCDGL